MRRLLSLLWKVQRNLFNLFNLSLLLFDVSLTDLFISPASIFDSWRTTANKLINVSAIVRLSSLSQRLNIFQPKLMLFILLALYGCFSYVLRTPYSRI